MRVKETGIGRCIHSDKYPLQPLTSNQVIIRVIQPYPTSLFKVQPDNHKFKET